MYRFYFSLSLILAAFSFSCSSGNRAFEKGAYDQAVMKSVKRLRKKSTNEKALVTLKKAYPLAQKWHQDNINRAKSSISVFKWEQVLREYQSLDNLYQQIQRCPACLEELSPQSFHTEIEQVKKQAAQVRFEQGDLHLNKAQQGRNKPEAHLAFDDFSVCQQLNPNYPEVRERLDRAKYEATYRIVVQQIPMHSRTFQLTNDFFQNKINEFLHSQTSNPFVEFYTQQEADNLGIKNIDQVLLMQFDDFVVGEATTVINNEQLIKDDVVIGQVEVEELQEETDDKGVTTSKKVKVKKDVLGTVEATLKTTTVQIESRGLLDFQIRDAYTEKILTQEKFPGTFVWQTAWGNFNGDERALTKKQYAITQTEPLLPRDYPLPQDLFVEFTAPIFDQLIQKIETFYARY